MLTINKKVLTESTFYWIPIAIVTIGLAIGLYATMQQIERLNTYDPQIQIVQDAVFALNEGKSTRDVVPAGDINIATTLSPFMIVYDMKGNAMASSGTLNGKIPTLPSGVIDYTKNNSIDKITWELSDGTREALVLERFDGPTSGFVAVARSLKTTESEIITIGIKIFEGTILLLILSFISTYGLFWWRDKKLSK